jgi:hypothetical protein
MGKSHTHLGLSVRIAMSVPPASVDACVRGIRMMQTQRVYIMREERSEHQLGVGPDRPNLVRLDGAHADLAPERRHVPVNHRTTTRPAYRRRCRQRSLDAPARGTAHKLALPHVFVRLEPGRFMHSLVHPASAGRVVGARRPHRRSLAWTANRRGLRLNRRRYPRAAPRRVGTAATRFRPSRARGAGAPYRFLDPG